MTPGRWWKCRDCYAVVSDLKVLRAPNPFDREDELVGCPECCEINQLELVCDEPSCIRYVTNGTPTPDGYRSTCSDHAPRRTA